LVVHGRTAMTRAKNRGYAQNVCIGGTGASTKLGRVNIPTQAKIRLEWATRPTRRRGATTGAHRGKFGEHGCARQFPDYLQEKLVEFPRLRKERVRMGHPTFMGAPPAKITWAQLSLHWSRLEALPLPRA